VEQRQTLEELRGFDAPQETLLRQTLSNPCCLTAWLTVPFLAEVHPCGSVSGIRRC
jgi:hypothetical protein